jgi:hypothetical protein
MRVPEEPVCIDLFRQNPVFTSLHLKYPVRVVPPQKNYAVSFYCCPLAATHSLFYDQIYIDFCCRGN